MGICHLPISDHRSSRWSLRPGPSSFISPPLDLPCPPAGTMRRWRHRHVMALLLARENYARILEDHLPCRDAGTTAVSSIHRHQRRSVRRGLLGSACIARKRRLAQCQVVGSFRSYRGDRNPPLARPSRSSKAFRYYQQQDSSPRTSLA